PLFSGFWSKDEILAVNYEAWHASPYATISSPYATIYCILFFSALFTAGLTAFYTFRAYFKTFWGEEKFPHEVGHHPHEAPPAMAWPLRILALGAVGVGALLGPTGLFDAILDAKWIELSFPDLNGGPHHANVLLMVTSSVVALVGIGIAYWMYVVQPTMAEIVARRMATL